jgi:putative spermidine/putrescine transport system substrate-binding protein
MGTGCNGCKPAAGPAAGGGRITVVTYGGGQYLESQQKAFFEPFRTVTAVEIESVTWGAEYGKLKSMVESGKITWDVVEVTSAQYHRGKRDKLFDKIDPRPPADGFIPESVAEDGVANVYWATVLAYKASQYPTRPPVTWREFWDTTTYPGGRALHDDPRSNLEFALLADGVAKENLYPLDVDRAFRKLDEIKPHIRVWWGEGAQPIQLLLTGQVVMSSAWSGRIYAHPEGRKAVHYSWQGAAQDVDYWVIPRGCPNRDGASRFIVYASEAEHMARQAEMIGYGPANRDALKIVKDETRAFLPTHVPNWSAGFVVDAGWWANNEAEMKARWLKWKQQ